jgi:hypothetical protein
MSGRLVLFLNMRFVRGFRSRIGMRKLHFNHFCLIVVCLLTVGLVRPAPGHFTEPDAPCATKRNAKAWAKVQAEIEHLKNTATGQPVVVKDLLVKIAP